MGDQGEQAHHQIRTLVESISLVDGHAHNVVALDSSKPFLSAFSEAELQALCDVPHTFTYKRSVDDIAGLYHVEKTLESIEKHRKALGLSAIAEKCFDAANIGTILLDNGLFMDRMKDLSWHNKYFRRVHRVLRIETVAEGLLDRGPPHEGVTWTLNSFGEQFVETLKSGPTMSPTVVAFKSIAAYRSGLDIDPLVTEQAAEEGLMEELKRGKPIRLQNKDFLNFLFTRALELATLREIPMQIHTGFGDKDLNLKFANPLCLRSVLEDRRFATSRLVLLHASYPYMRQAAYLSSVYPQVHLDFGLAVPKLSVRGMKSVIAELFELAPLNKVMFSTDGFAFPETFFLGSKWARKILSEVLCEAYDDGDISMGEALSAAKGILQTNAVSFYKLEADTSSNFTHVEKAVPLIAPIGEGKKVGDFGQGKVDHFRLLWADGAGLRRCRVVPLARYESVVVSHGVGLAKACMGMSSSSDGPSRNSGLSAVGEIRLVPDRSTEQQIPWMQEHGIVLADMHIKPGTPWEYCPRSTLRRLVNLLDEEFGLTVRAGFETEFYILESTTGPQNWRGVDFTNYCSSSGLNEFAPVLSKIASALESLNITVEQYHAEAGGGQFEFALEHAPALAAADKLLLAREAIVATSKASNYLATFLPKLPLENTQLGSGCHAHVSLWKEGQNVFMGAPGSGTKHGMSTIGEHFLAGVLDHLPAVLAFTAPHPVSYKRIQPNTWSGAYQVWGHDNREAPLRTASPPGVPDGLVSNFEVKAFDGCANPHLGLAAIIAAGIDGLRKGLSLPPPTSVNPADLDRGSVNRLPTKLSEAVEILQGDEPLQILIGVPLVTAISAIRLADEEHFCRSSPSKLIYLY